MGEGGRRGWEKEGVCEGGRGTRGRREGVGEGEWEGVSGCVGESK